MKRVIPNRFSFACVLICLFILSLTACSPASTPAPAATEAPVIPPKTEAPLPTETEPTLAPSPTAQEEIALELSSPTATMSLTMADLKALPAVEGQAGIKSSTGKITIPTLFKGVSLEELAGLVGGLDETLGLNIVAADGYAMTLSSNQVKNGDFIVYDPATGDEIKIDDPLQAILAYEIDGQPLPENSDGHLRLVVISPKNNQVTDGHWSVKWVNKVELKPLGEEWSLKMSGAIEDTIDRNTFQSCAAPSCHGATWQDDKAQTWAGVPLWLLMGRVDDEIKHEGPAFLDALAKAGYTVEIMSTDGFSITFDSLRVMRDNNLVVAYQVNDNPLPDKYFPLRLVGTGLEKNEMIGAIDAIHLKIAAGQPQEPAATEAPAETEAAPEATTPADTEAAVAPEGEAALKLYGAVNTPLAWQEAELRAMDVVQLTAEHPKKGQEQYEGVRLGALLMQAGIKPEAKKLLLTAADGYSIEVELSAVQACADCLVAFTETPGELKLVMPGMESSAWVKDIALIEVK